MASKLKHGSSTVRKITQLSNDLDQEGEDGSIATYTVHIPLTPDNQPMEISLESHPQMAGAKGSSCAVPGCDGRVMTDERGLDVVPCECDYKICRDCYRDAVRTGDGICPGCKDPYKEPEVQGGANQQTLPLPPGAGVSKMERRLSLMKSRSQNNEFDHAQWLFETKGSYGYGNAMWPKDSEPDGSSVAGSDWMGGDPNVFSEKQWKPLTRKLSISAAVLSPYRLIILIRLVVLALFLKWRIQNPNENAVWLWGMSVVCEIWFGFSWLLDQLPKLFPINRVADLDVLREKFETSNPTNPTGKSDLPGIDMFVSTADPEKEPPLVTANTILSILAADYPVEKLSCYVSDDGGALLTFEAMAEAASFANMWVPFCRKHDIEPRNPESYFNLKRDPFKNKVRSDFVRDRRRVKREYDEFKVRINSLPDSIRRRSDAYNAREEIKALKKWRENGHEEPMENLKFPKATWMADGTHWPGTWTTSAPEHSRGDHASIIQVMLKPPSDEPLTGTASESNALDLTEVDIRLPMLVYVSREKRPGYDHNKKAGAMNALVRASAIMSNGPFILNLDCDHYIFNSQALREGMCFMMDRGGERLCYVQFPQRFEGIDPNDRYANHNTVFFDVNMRALDGIQGPVYVGTGCLFRRTALYGFDPPLLKEETKMTTALVPKKFGNSSLLVDSIKVAEFQGLPLADHSSIKYGRPPGALTLPRDPLDAATVAEAINVISCWYEDKTEWGLRIGWIYGSVTEDVVTGYRMHNRGWKSVYCFIVESLQVTFLVYLLGITLTLVFLAALEIKWSGIELEEWWRNEQFWLIGGTSAHFAAVLQGLLKVTAGIEISFTLTSKSGGDDENDEYADLYVIKWTSLMIPPITIMMVNLIAIAVAVSRTIYSEDQQWSSLLGGVFFSFWVLAHLYPFAKGLMGRRGRTPTIVFVWSGLISITISLLWVAIDPPSGSSQIGGSFQFP
uniref:Cellulose synthase-like protein D3 n=1 Tax=Cajanus cajan TaxID=3821 RepID=A0A151THD5_CAJCA|nr:Cellulose synthase-like protein D3 [Cajanus cajan]